MKIDLSKFPLKQAWAIAANFALGIEQEINEFIQDDREIPKHYEEELKYYRDFLINTGYYDTL